VQVVDNWAGLLLGDGGQRGYIWWTSSGRSFVGSVPTPPVLPGQLRRMNGGTVWRVLSGVGRAVYRLIVIGSPAG
jgi:hypothetical protein